MDIGWVRSAEKIVLLSESTGSRIIGFTSPEPISGVSLLSSAVGEVFALSGFRTLLIDATARENAGRGSGWVPGEKTSRSTTQYRGPALERLVVRITPKSRFAFNNTP